MLIKHYHCENCGISILSGELCEKCIEREHSRQAEEMKRYLETMELIKTETEHHQSDYDQRMNCAKCNPLLRGPLENYLNEK